MSRDLFEGRPVILTLDKPYILRFTLGSLFILEGIYGSFRGAAERLTSRDELVLMDTLVDFLYALLALERSQIRSCLTPDKAAEALGKILEAGQRHLPENGGGESADVPLDWDWLYYVARYRLLLTEREFFDCTPRRFHKLWELWGMDHGLIEQKEKPVFIDQLAF